MHFAHRVGALIVAIAVVATAVHVWFTSTRRRELRASGGPAAGPRRRADHARRAHRAQPARRLDQQRACRLRRARVDDVAGADAADVADEFARRTSGYSRALPVRGTSSVVSACTRTTPCTNAASARMKGAAVAASQADSWRTLSDYVALTKPRLNVLVVATSAAGYYLGATAALDAGRVSAGGRRHCARRRRRRRAQSGVRTRHRRADAADANASAADGRVAQARRDSSASCSSLAGLLAPGARARTWLAVAARARDARHLPRRLHAAQAPVADRRRSSAPFPARCRRSSAGPRRTAASSPGGVALFRDRVPLADPALHGHRVDVSRRLRQRRVSDAAGHRSGRPPRRTAGGRVRGRTAAGRAWCRRSWASAAPSTSAWPLVLGFALLWLALRFARSAYRRSAHVRCSSDRSPICRSSGSR